MRQNWFVLLILGSCGCQGGGGFTDPLFRHDPTFNLREFGELDGVWESPEFEASGGYFRLGPASSRVELRRTGSVRSPAYEVRFAELEQVHLPIKLELRIGTIGETTIGQLCISPGGSLSWYKLSQFGHDQPLLPVTPIHHYFIVRTNDNDIAFCPIEFKSENGKGGAGMPAYTICAESVRKLITALPDEEIDAWFDRATNSMTTSDHFWRTGNPPRVTMEEIGFTMTLQPPLTFSRVSEFGTLRSLTPKNYDVVLPALISSATAVNERTFHRNEKKEVADFSLTSELIRLHQKDATLRGSGVEFFSDAPLDPLVVAREITGPRTVATRMPVPHPLTLFHHENVRNVEVTSFSGDKATGCFDFLIPHIGKGRVTFSAGLGRGREWDILELAIPGTPIRLVRFSSGSQWGRVQDDGRVTFPDGSAIFRRQQ